MWSKPLIQKLTFKLIRFEKQGAKLVPLNPDYPSVSLGDIHIEKLYCVLGYKVDWR